MSVPVHPEAGASSAQVRWVVPAGLVPFTGPAGVLPGFADWLASGVISRIDVEPRAVVMDLGAGHGWDRWGAPVRSALTAALGQVEQWRPLTEEQRDPDAVLRAAVAAVIAGPTGDYVRSHGGCIDVGRVSEGCVDLAMSGTCGHCPALSLATQARIEGAVRAEYPLVREVRLRRQ